MLKYDPQKCISHQRITRLLAPICTHHTTNGISIPDRFIRFSTGHVRDQQTRRQTYKPRYNGSNRPHLMLCIAMLPHDVKQNRNETRPVNAFRQLTTTSTWFSESQRRRVISASC